MTGSKHDDLRDRLTAAFEGGRDPFASGVLRAVVESVPSRIAAVTPSGELVYVHRFPEGYGPEDLEGLSIYQFLDAPTAEVARRCITEVARSREPASFHAVVAPRSRRPTSEHYEVRVAPLVEGGEVVALALVATDVTAREIAQRALRSSEQALALAVEATGMGIWSWDQRTDEVIWDDMMCRHLGLSEGGHLTSYRGYIERVFPDDRDEVARSVQRAMETGTYEDLLHRIVVDGEIRWVLVKGHVIRDEHGNAIGLRGGVFDVTERKRMDVEMRDRQKIEAVGELAAGVAHNFNNMLTAIMGNLSVLESSVDSSLRQYVDAAMEASVAASAVVRSLVSVTRRERTPIRRKVRLRQLVHRVAKLVSSSLSSSVRFELDDRLVGDEPWIEVLGGDLEHALLNLCLNGRDAAVSAGVADPTVRVTVHRRPARPGDARGWVEVVVRDNGTGMDEETRAHIFEPFFTTKAEGVGSGLGLFTAHRTVNDHGGLIQVRSELGRGSIFSILLPEAPAPEEERRAD